MKDVYARGMMATTAYLERMGMVVMNNSAKSHIIALDEDTVVYVDLKIGMDVAEFPRPSSTTIKKHLKEAAEYAAKKGLTVPARFDLVTIRIIKEDRALLRHERNLEA